MAKKQLTKRVESEIQRLVEKYGYSGAVLREFALFTLEKEPAKGKKEPTKGEKKVTKTKGLSLPELKQAIYQHFSVKDTTALKKSGTFQMATSGMDKLDLSKKAGWEDLYRKLIGVLPGEENEQGYGCVNGINILKYDLPWNAFGLDPKTAKTEEIKASYRDLSKIYHPDNTKTGDAQIFNRLTVFYKSLTEKF
ncbi:J domain-containing protein [Trichocoleus sp. FACHB-591]|uniref:J domain-containing protein n=1 Tax=Trichocoleus sp. FACHB-591 TaxID=2692872 RepID=UPI0016856573|nr:J domain-containing protein [Trichocoleus sp. FACHB-591]MBD2094491.1 J domain-containing protein [Trichocoleus sp. FACHB-591]